MLVEERPNFFLFYKKNYKPIIIGRSKESAAPLPDKK